MFDPTDSRVIPLVPDGLFRRSLQPLPFLSGMAGVLDSRGRGTAAFRHRDRPILHGFRFFVSGVVLDRSAQSGVTAVLPAARVTLP